MRRLFIRLLARVDRAILSARMWLHDRLHPCPPINKRGNLFYLPEGRDVTTNPHRGALWMRDADAAVGATPEALASVNVNEISDAAAAQLVKHSMRGHQPDRAKMLERLASRYARAYSPEQIANMTVDPELKPYLDEAMKEWAWVHNGGAPYSNTEVQS